MTILLDILLHTILGGFLSVVARLCFHIKYRGDKDRIRQTLRQQYSGSYQEAATLWLISVLQPVGIAVLVLLFIMFLIGMGAYMVIE